MKKKQIAKLIKALEVRWKQFEKDFNGEPLPYKLHDGHHMRDVRTTLAVLKGEKNADAFLRNMSSEKDLIVQKKGV